MHRITTKVRKNMERLLFLVAFSLCLSAEGSDLPTRLDAPTANLAIGDATPLALVQRIALRKAIQKWGPGALGDPIALCGLDGNIKAYMFSFHFGGDVFPSYDQMLLKVKAGRNLRDHLKRSELKKAKDLYQDMNPMASSNEAVSPDQGPEMGQAVEHRSTQATARKAKRVALKEMQRHADKQSIGADEYGTIVVSATYKMAPVLCYLHYLAPYYFNFDLALEKAEQVLGSGAQLERIYFLGLNGQFFKFISGANSILLNAKSLAVTDEIELTGAQASDAQGEARSEKRQRLKDEMTKKWDKLKSEVGEE